jgi:hypothetical protein
MANIQIGNDPLQRFLKEQSTHKSITQRQEVYERLGLNKPGFWVDLKQRTLKQNQPAGDMASTAEQPTDFQDPYDSQSTNYTIDPPAKLNPTKPLKMPLIPGQGQPQQGAPPNLPQKEKELAWRQMQTAIRENPILSTTAIDSMTAEKITMNAELVMAMNSDPTKFMSTALIDYYNSHTSWTLQDTRKTNFEITESNYSTVKKIAAKNTGRMTGTNDANRKKVFQENRFTNTGKSNINIGKNAYNSPLYQSPFG